jgi:hypothetical protein
MAVFTDLPPELVHPIISAFRKPQVIADMCLVNRLFHHFAVPLLYEQIFVYPWHKNGKQKV